MSKQSLKMIASIGLIGLFLSMIPFAFASDAEENNTKPLTTKEQIAKLVEEIQLDDAYVENLSKTDSDIFCMAVNNYYEARGEGLNGKIAVSEVVVNRSNHPAYPNSPCGVVKQASVRDGLKVCQFSWVCNRGVKAPAVGKEGSVNHREWYQSIVAAIIVYRNQFSGVAKGATHFYLHKSVSPVWSRNGSMTFVTREGNHTFLKHR